MRLCVAILLVLTKTVASLFCYWNSGCPYKYFSDKTPYNNVRGDIRDSIVKLKGCEPISIWALISAGKSISKDFLRRFNESQAIRADVISSYQQGKSSLCAQDIENLQNWSDDRILTQTNFLTDEGSQEVIGIANRLQQAFPKLLQNLNEHYKVASASDSVTEESAKSFINSFINNRFNLEKVVDDVVSPHKTCKRYQGLLQNPNTYSNVEKYKKTPEYLVTKDRMQRRLGIDYKLTDENVQTLYDLCRYTWSDIANKFSPWCALFTTEDLRVLEYIDDLQLYYKNGYGNIVNGLLGKAVLSDLLRKFQEATQGKQTNLVAYFTDTATLNMVASALDLFKDESPLNSKRDPKRKWRNSKISVFSANLIAVLNRCGVPGDTDYNVVFYWNEEPLLPICEMGFCSWEEFNYKLHTFSSNTTEFCNK